MLSSAEDDSQAGSAVIEDSPVLVAKKGTGQYGDISSSKKRGVKRKMTIVRDEFTIKSVEGKKIAMCNNCKKAAQGPVLTINTTRLREHLLCCLKVSKTKRSELYASSQHARKLSKINKLKAGDGRGSPGSPSFPSSKTPNKTIGGELLSEIRATRNVHQMATLGTPVRKTYDGTLSSFVSVFTKDRKQLCIRAVTETLLSRFEPLERIEDPFFLAECNITCPGLAEHLPSAEGILSTYLHEIDADCIKQLDELSANIPGDMSISIDGVQVGGHNCLLFTKSKGILTQYPGLEQLQDKVHVTNEEIQAHAKS